MTDFDGVIVDSLDCYVDALITAFHQYGLTRIRTRADFLGLFRANLYESLGEAGLSEKTVDDVLAAMDAVIKRKNLSFDFYPGMREALNTLCANHPLFVITSNQSETVSRFLSEHGVTGVREVLGVDQGRSKSEKIRRVADRMPGNEYYYIGDTIGDIREARSAGVIAVGAAWGWHGREALLTENPDILLETISDFLTAFTPNG